MGKPSIGSVGVLVARVELAPDVAELSVVSLGSHSNREGVIVLTQWAVAVARVGDVDLAYVERGQWRAVRACDDGALDVRHLGDQLEFFVQRLHARRPFHLVAVSRRSARADGAQDLDRRRELIFVQDLEPVGSNDVDVGRDLAGFHPFHGGVGVHAAVAKSLIESLLRPIVFGFRILRLREVDVVRRRLEDLQHLAGRKRRLELGLHSHRVYEPGKTREPTRCLAGAAGAGGR
jgi:hypothetical protein